MALNQGRLSECNNLFLLFEKTLLPHLNFLNPKSVTSLLKENGFHVLEAITPGKLDVDILKKGIDRVVEKYPLPIGILVRGNKTGLSVTIDSNFDKVPEKVFETQRRAVVAA